MIFQGDLSKYHPADALMFLSQLSLNGVLSVVHEDRMLTLSFKDGFLLEGQSAKADEKILRMLRLRKWIDAAQEGQIRQIRGETGMPVRQILYEIKLLSLAGIKGVLETGILEVLLELFLLSKGSFHFTDTPVDADSVGIKMDTGALCIRMLSQADEFRNFEKSIVSLDRPIAFKRTGGASDSSSMEEKWLAHMAAQPIPVAQLIAQAPFGSHEAMRIIERMLGEQKMELAPGPPNSPPVAGLRETSIDPLFSAYKQAFKMLMTAGDVLKKVEAIIAFCKNYYDAILILTAKGSEIIHAKVIRIEKDKRIHQQSLKGPIATLDQDPVLQAVQRSGIGFFGQVFPSAVLDKLVKTPATGECALLPVLNTPQLSMFFYASSQTIHAGLSPHHYLELLAWLITPAEKFAAAAPAVGSTASATLPGTLLPSTGPADTGGSQRENLVRLVDKIDELPPFPLLASKILELLSDPDTPIEKVGKTIAQDQALVAKLIKVSNSALYGGIQKVDTLLQALTRLGVKTTKSLILSASTRGYFFKERGGMKAWGQYLWQHSVEVGYACRRIAVCCRYDDPEQAFIAGIMHDIGKLVILMLDHEKYKEIQRYKVAEKLTDLTAETEILGMNHVEFGRLLMKKWHMPETVRASTQYHHCPEQAPEHGALIAIVAYGNYLSHTMGNHLQPDTIEDPSVALKLVQMLGLSEEAHAALIETIRADFQNADLII